MLLWLAGRAAADGPSPTVAHAVAACGAFHADPGLFPDHMQQVPELIFAGGSAGRPFATLAAAVAAASPGAVIEVRGGRYPERIILDRPVTIQAAPGEAVEINWQSNQPYEATVQCSIDGVVLRRLRIRHHSPSIANNYAVQLQVGVWASRWSCRLWEWWYQDWGVTSQGGHRGGAIAYQFLASL